MHKPTYRVIKILDIISNHQEKYTLSELTRLTDIPIGTISPIVKTLVESRLLEFDPTTNKYGIGIEAYYIGSSYVSKNSVLELIREEMTALSETCGETCQLGILKEGQVFYLLKVEGQEPIRVVSQVGGRLPAYATALGKAILAYHDEDELNTLYQDGLKSLTPFTVTDLDVLKRQLAQVRQAGFSTEDRESNEHTSCIGVPIFQNQKIAAGLSVVYPSFTDNPEKTEVIKAALLKYKMNIEKILRDRNLL